MMMLLSLIIDVILPEIITIIRCVIKSTDAKKRERNTCRTRYLRNLFASPFSDPFTLRPFSLPFTAPTYPFSLLESWSRTLVSFFGTPPFVDLFWGFVLRYYSPRLSRFLAPRSSVPSSEPTFLRTDSWIDRLRERLSRRSKVTRQ
jgi:hypothetical protein